jgi:hypothetical protein
MSIGSIIMAVAGFVFLIGGLIFGLKKMEKK